MTGAVQDRKSKRKITLIMEVCPDGPNERIPLLENLSVTPPMTTSPTKMIKSTRGAASPETSPSSHCSMSNKQAKPSSNSPQDKKESKQKTKRPFGSIRCRSVRKQRAHSFECLVQHTHCLLSWHRVSYVAVQSVWSNQEMLLRSDSTLFRYGAI